MRQFILSKNNLKYLVLLIIFNDTNKKELKNNNRNNKTFSIIVRKIQFSLI